MIFIKYLPFSKHNNAFSFQLGKNPSVPYHDLGNFMLSGSIALSAPPSVLLQVTHCAPGTKGFFPFLRCTSLFLFGKKIEFVLCFTQHSPLSLCIAGSFSCFRRQLKCPLLRRATPQPSIIEKPCTAPSPSVMLHIFSSSQY